MKTHHYLPIALLLLMACTSKQQKVELLASQFPAPPVALKKDSVITFHNHSRTDSYFWMRLTDEQKEAATPDAQTKQVLDYLNAENEYTKTVMKSTDSLQEKLFNEIVGKIKQTDESVPYFKKGYWYYRRFEEKQEYPIFCRKPVSLDGAEQVLLNLNEMGASYAYYNVGDWEVSPDNKLIAFTEDTVSRRVYTIKFKNLETGELLADQIENAEASGAWGNDNKTFFYTTKDPVSLLSNKIWRHKIGTKPTDDVLVYTENDPSYYIGVYKSKSEKYVIIYNSSTLSSDYHLIEADKPDQKPVQFTPRETVHEYSIDHFDDKFYIVTNWEAQNFRLMETPINATSKANWKEVIPHRADVLLNSLEIFKDYLVLNERKNANTQLRIIHQTTKEEHYLDFGEPAYVADFGINPEYDTPILRYSYSSMTTPNSVFDYNMDTRAKELKKQQEVVGGHNPADYVTERITVDSRDGKKIPVSIVYKKGFKKNGEAPMLLYAYGSYGMSMDPYFSITRLSLLDRGFVFAIAHIRGGQEMGRQWYDDGKMFNKLNTFNDYIDCAKSLINDKYTSNEHLYAMGGSAGGLLMGAVANMAPELFNGIVAQVPFVDVINTMLDETIPLTTNEFDEWGNPKKEEAYNYMLKYSPYDNVTAKDYPHLLVMTGLFDSQVQYWEPAKWVAKLRTLKTDDHLLLLNTNMDAGHGGASGRFKAYREVALEYAFLFNLEGIKE